MKQAPIRLGPLALLLTVISICLTTLAVLVFTTARADKALAEKYAQTVRVRYELEAEGQRSLSRLEAGVRPDDCTEDEDGTIRYTLSQDGSMLRVGLEPDDGGYRVVIWRHEREWTQEEILDNLWNGQ